MKNLELLTDAFRTFGSAKELARAGGISEITAYRYQNALTKPDLGVVTRLMGKSRAVADAVLRMAGLDERSLELDALRIARELAELQQQWGAMREDLERLLAAREARLAAAENTPPPGHDGADAPTDYARALTE